MNLEEKFWCRRKKNLQKHLISNDRAGFDEYPFDFWYLQVFEENQSTVLVMEPDWTAVRQTELHTEICGVFDCEKQIVQLSLHNMNLGTDKNLLNLFHIQEDV